jgi:arsenate reductase (glutaredoxin)
LSLFKIHIESKLIFFFNLYFVEKNITNFMIQIYHNSRCTKSRECLNFLEKSNIQFTVINYLQNTPTFDELKSIIDILKIKPIKLVRQKERIWIENFKDKILTDDEVIHTMVSNPILIERPIVINENKAVIARPLENIFTVI